MTVMDRHRWSKMIFRAFLAPLSAALFGQPAHATLEYNLTVARVGVQGAQAYIGFTTALTAVCNNNVAYVTLDADSKFATFSVGLSARAAGRLINRIDYTKDGTGKCFIDLLEF